MQDNWGINQQPLDTELEADWLVYSELLVRWQKIINLVAPSTLPMLRVRHYLDSVQIRHLVPDAKRWIDLGSGAGFPGLVTALQLKGIAGACVHLIESDQRKCAFLREVSRETKAPALVHCGRIENVLPEIAGEIQAVSARALAPLSRLIQLSTPILLAGATGVFPKGQYLVNELTEASIDSRFSLNLVASKTESQARIVLVRAASNAANRPRT